MIFRIPPSSSDVPRGARDLGCRNCLGPQRDAGISAARYCGSCPVRHRWDALHGVNSLRDWRLGIDLMLSPYREWKP